MNRDLPPEKHLIILWPSCEPNRSAIDNAISKSMKVLTMSYGEWSESNADANYSRFYQENLFESNDIISEKGIGLFHIYVVLDPNPKYDFQETSSGYKFVNLNVFKLKQELRVLTLGGHKVHSTNSQEELRRDVAMLWGIDVLEVHDFEKFVPNKITGTFGIDGFADINEVFMLLNSCTDYLVLRNYEEILDLEKSEHPDIDLLVSDVVKASLVLNADPVFPDDFRVHYKNLVSGREVFWDLRSPVDGYMDCNWAVELKNARTKIFIDSLDLKIYGLVARDYYYSLAYHAIIHKQEVSKDYFFKLSNLSGKDLLSNLDSTDFLINDVAKYMAERNFQVTRPIDSSVFFNLDNSAAITATKSVIQFESFLKNVKSYAGDLIKHEIFLTDTFHTECIVCRTRHFCIQLSFQDSRYNYYGSQLPNGKFFLMSLSQNFSVSNFFTFTKSKWSQRCPNCLRTLNQLGVNFMLPSDLYNKDNSLYVPLIIWSKEYFGSSIWQSSTFGLVRSADQMQITSQIDESNQNLRNFSFQPKFELVLSESDVHELCINYLKFGLIAGATALFSVFYKLMANSVESDSIDNRWINVDMTMSNLIFVNGTFEWVDREIFGLSILPKQYIKLRCTLVSLVLILQADFSSDSKEMFLSNVWEKLAIEFLDVDFMEYLEYEFELQSSVRAVDYNTFVNEQAGFFYNLMNKNFSSAMTKLRSFDSVNINSEIVKSIDSLEMNEELLRTRLEDILGSYSWKVGKFLVSSPILIIRMVAKKVLRVFN